VLQGEYRLNLGKPSFARYAYFSNIRTSNGLQATGSNIVWFSDNELIDGPVHSNEYLRFASYTSNQTRTWFGEEVTVAGCVNPTKTACGTTKNPGDYFNGNTTLRSPNIINNHCTTVICPEFAKGATFNAAYLPLPVHNNQQRDAAYLVEETNNSGTTTYKSGLFLGDYGTPANSKPIKDIQLSTNTVSGVTYQVMRVAQCTTTGADPTTCATTVMEYRYTKTNNVATDRLLEQRDITGVSNPTWTSPVWAPTTKLYNGQQRQITFNGMIYVDKSIGSLGGPARTTASNPDTAPAALTEFAAITVAARDKIAITRDLKYTTPPCTGNPTRVNGVVQKATCTTAGLASANILGVYSQMGDVVFGNGTNTKLANLTVHAVVMSANGRVGTNNWDQSLGTASDLRLLGGVIGHNVAGFSNGTGYRRVFTYDRRMLDGLAPPYFPFVETDKLQSVFVFTYGQREQVF
jgi:hypothetical protein